MPDALLVGAAEVDITPPVGVSLAGSLQPRPSIGIDDPLFAKAVVLESRGVTIAYVLLDLIALGRSEGDRAVQLASAATGIPAEQIVWAASHTHTGPYTMHFLGAEGKDVDEAWLAGLPARIAEAVTKAWEARQPAHMSRLRGYCSRVSHNRRLKMKDGRELNTWLLHRGEDEVQCLGAAGPIDPELGMLCFDDAAGDPIAVLWQFTLHTNTNFGPRFSGDYPAVVAARLRERFGRDVVSLFVPGACADINTPGPFYREVGNTLADVMVPLLAKRTPRAGGLALGARKARVVVSYRDFTADQEARIRDSQWPPADQESFRQELAVMREVGVTEEESVVQAWRIGEVAFASLPGELFVEWGLKLKAESPFPWTYPVELGGDYLGYLVTEQAWAAGGYESLIARSARPSVEGVARLYAAAQGLLGQLWAETPA